MLIKISTKTPLIHILDLHQNIVCTPSLFDFKDVYSVFLYKPDQHQ